MAENQEEKPEEKRGFKERVSGTAQVDYRQRSKTLRRRLTADPITQAEGEFNVEVGTAREEAEGNLEAGEELDRRDAETKR